MKEVYTITTMCKGLFMDIEAFDTFRSARIRWNDLTGMNYHVDYEYYNNDASDAGKVEYYLNSIEVQEVL